MNVVIERANPQQIVVRLREGTVEATVTGWHTSRAVTALLTALETVATGEGYAECFWPEPTGQYWWMLNREGQRLEVVVLWSRGAVTGWEHVFRAADEVNYIIERVREEMAAHDLLPK
ncbi:MAG: hypothetical protein IT183_03015 [Acidobacteria bacterium]|nr:hypothetical protein [Acidobacteriota bacterium]